MQKKLVLSFNVFLLFFMLLSVKAYAFTGSGKGTATEPYLITNASQLQEINNDLKAAYKLANDIDLENKLHTPIGKYEISNDYSKLFSGTFDGDGCTISNLKINTDKSYVGLFGYTNVATIKNITIENVDITSTNHKVGALVGYAMGKGEINNCHIKGNGSVKGDISVGGLVGANQHKVINCSSTIDVQGKREIGGLIGFSNNNSVSQCYATGNVSSKEDYVGGLIGSSSYSSISDCYATGDVKGTEKIAGLIGYLNWGKLSNCYAIGKVTSTNNKDYGGLVGFNYSGTLTNSYFDSVTTGLTTPSTDARTTAQLMTKSNFKNWDFNTVWGIQEGVTYPYLLNMDIPFKMPSPGPTGLKATGKTSNSIALSWDSIANANEYEITYGDMVLNSTTNSIVITNLNADTEYTFKVRAKISTEVSQWGESLLVRTNIVEKDIFGTIAAQKENALFIDDLIVNFDLNLENATDAKAFTAKFEYDNTKMTFLNPIDLPNVYLVTDVGGKVQLVATLDGKLTTDEISKIFTLSFSVNKNTRDEDVSVHLTDLILGVDKNSGIQSIAKIKNDSAKTYITFFTYDFNLDGNIDMGDIVFAEQYLGVKADDADWHIAKRCDVDNDNEITITDIISAVEYILAL